MKLNLLHYILIISIGLNMVYGGLYYQIYAALRSTNNLMAIWTAITGVIVISFGSSFGLIELSELIRKIEMNTADIAMLWIISGVVLTTIGFVMNFYIGVVIAAVLMLMLWDIDVVGE